MKAAAVAISTGVLAISLALPALLFAQDAPPPTPAAEATPPVETPAAAADPAAPPVTEPAPPSEGDPAITAGATANVATTAVAKGSASVQMQDFAFSPASVTINVGDSVTWSNVGAEDHDAASSAFSTGTVSPGSSATETFSTAGTFSYVCSFHPQMKGTIQVSGAADKGTTTDPGSTALPGTEAAAAAATDAAGSASALPSTGQSEPPLLVVGLGLVGCGAIAALLARWREREDLL